MPPVFGRFLPHPHPYDGAIATWLASSSADDRSMVINLMHDHRVNMNREQEFDKFVKRPCLATDLKRACDDYFKTKIRTRSLPHYVYKIINANNLLNGHITIRPQIKKDQKLVRVVDINGLRYVFQWAKNRRKWGRIFSNFPRTLGDREVMQWLDGLLGATSPERFIEVILDVMNIHRREHPFQPTWASMWSGFKRYASDGPNRWMQAFGMHKPGLRWLMLLGYTVAEAGTVARPTQLDGGWYSYHFPSPPNAPLSVGGHPMDLRILPRTLDLLPEYIHKQIHHPLEHWTDLGKYLGRTVAPTSVGISDQRQAHHELLARQYGGSVYSWMPRPT